MSVILPYINWSGADNYIAIVNIVYQDTYTAGTEASPTEKTGIKVMPATVENPAGITLYAGIKSCDIQLYSNATTPTDLLISLPAIAAGSTSLSPVYSLCNPTIKYTVGTDSQGNNIETAINSQIYSSIPTQTGNYAVVGDSYMAASAYKYPPGSLQMGLPTLTQSALEALDLKDDVFDDGLGMWAWIGIGLGVLLLVVVVIVIVYLAFFKKKKGKKHVDADGDLELEAR